MFDSLWQLYEPPALEANSSLAAQRYKVQFTAWKLRRRGHLAGHVLALFDPTPAAVPGLVIQGTEDNIATQEDADDLAAAYGSEAGAGGHAKITRIEGAGHIPRIEPPPLNHEFVEFLLEFFDSN